MNEHPEVTRFAPSPTGFLHLGHAFAALFAWQAAKESNGRFLLRIEDIDQTRCRAEFEQAIYEDLAWLGSGLPGWGWEKPVRRQSEHMAEYRKALDKLEGEGLIYPCFCTRAQILAEVAKAGMAPHGVEGPSYPGICRTLSTEARTQRIAAGETFALRLNLARALAKTGALTWHDRKQGTIAARPEIFGDVVLARKETPASYHLAVTLDDHAQGVTLVTRGEDLFDATHIQRLLQALLGLNTPDYAHHPLICDEQGKRFAKRDKAATLRALRFAGVSPKDMRSKAHHARHEA
jgi:glutamyl-Q tRNA(Asp) synthetase